MKKIDELKLTRQDFERKWKNLTITDDFIFGKVFSDKNLCKNLIEILLNVKIKELKLPPEYQKTFQAGANSHGVRFDVYTESENEAFDIEIQTTKRADLPLRMRYYQSSMDTSLIHKGQNYSDLKQTYVLFISTVDQFGFGEPVYEIVSVVKNHPEFEFNDRRKEVVYNVKAYEKIDDDNAKSFLEYMATGEAKMKFEKQVAEKVDELKEDEYWKNNYIHISLWEQDAIARGLEKGMRQGIRQGIAEQKAKDEKIIAEKENEIENQISENKRLSERIKYLEALLDKKN